MQPAVELVGVLLARVVEVEAEGRVEADAEVVVHDEYLRIVLAGRAGDGGVLHGSGAEPLVLLLRVKDDGPAVEPDLLGVDHVAEEVQRVLAAGVARAPPEDAREVVARAEGHDRARRRGALAVLADVVQALEHPADRPVAAAHQDLVVLYVPEHVQSTVEGKQLLLSLVLSKFYVQGSSAHPGRGPPLSRSNTW